MYKKKYSFALSVITLACVTSAFAATPVKLNKLSVSSLQAIVSIPATSSSFSASQQSSLKEISRHVDANHTTHIRVQQMYAGYPVWGGDAVLHVPHNEHVVLTNLANNTTMNGTMYQDLTADLINISSTSFTTTQADKALQHAIQLYQTKTGIQKFDDSHSKKNLLVYIDNKNKAHWAYLVNFQSGATNNMPAMPTYILDATTLAVYEEWDNVQTVSDVSGGGFGGNPKMGKLSYDGLSGDYPGLSMQRDDTSGTCYVQNDNVIVRDDYLVAGPIVFSRPIKFSCSNQDATHNSEYWDADLQDKNGGYSPANDALYIGKVIKEMYQNWYGLPVLSDDSGQPITLTMHVHTKGFFDTPMDNAYFLSSTDQMYFGDGALLFYPLTSLGVGAHEISHGFTSQHSNLTYIHQSGGLNESFSDMAAQAAEYYSTGKNSWEIGPEILKGSGALRYMNEPSKDGHSIDNAREYTDELDVHYTSGVFNKVFYLIGTSTGWNTRKAFDVMVGANMDYWTATSTFQDAACGVVSATKDYHYDVATINAAMSKVGIDTTTC